MVDLLPPLNDIVVVEPEALFSEAQHRTRRRPLPIGGGAALLAAALAIGIMLVTSDNGGAASPPPPGFASGHLSYIESYASNIVRVYSRAPVKTALIYSTTRKKAFDAGTGMDPSSANRRAFSGWKTPEARNAWEEQSVGLIRDLKAALKGVRLTVDLWPLQDTDPT